jgi:hypothetical protein
MGTLVTRVLRARGTRKNRRTTLVATMEYGIEDWVIKANIDGLGVMAQLMGKNLESQNLVGDIDC